MKGFTVSETELLLNEAVAATKCGQPLSSVFERVAIKTKRAKGSVRNYYYSIIKDEEKKNRFSLTVNGIDGLKAAKAKAFTCADEKLLLDAIKEGKAKGQSVRRIIMELSDGDQKLALRYQNKYRNVLKKQEKAGMEAVAIQPEDFRYFAKLSHEIDALVERIKDKYAAECVKLKKENEELARELKALKKLRLNGSVAANFFYGDKKSN